MRIRLRTVTLLALVGVLSGDFAVAFCLVDCRALATTTAATAEAHPSCHAAAASSSGVQLAAAPGVCEQDHGSAVAETSAARRPGGLERTPMFAPGAPPLSLTTHAAGLTRYTPGPFSHPTVAAPIPLRR